MLTMFLLAIPMADYRLYYFYDALHKNVKLQEKQLSTSKERLSRRKPKDIVLSDQDKEKLAAFVAIKCAAQTASCQLSLAQIVGDHATSKEALDNEAWLAVPQFMALDLVGDYVIGEQRHVYKGQFASCELY